MSKGGTRGRLTKVAYNDVELAAWAMNAGYTDEDPNVIRAAYQLCQDGKPIPNAYRPKSRRLGPIPRKEWLLIYARCGGDAKAMAKATGLHLHSVHSRNSRYRKAGILPQ